MRKSFLPFIGIILLGSCTTATHNRVQNIVVETPYVKGASCAISDAKGNDWYIHRTPDTVAVKAGHPPLTFICDKNGYQNTVTMVDAVVPEYHPFPQNLSKVNMLFEEVVGIVADPYAELGSRYPATVKIWMEPLEWELPIDRSTWISEKIAYYVSLEKERKAQEEANHKAREEAKKRWDKMLEEKKKRNAVYENQYPPGNIDFRRPLTKHELEWLKIKHEKAKKKLP